MSEALSMSPTIGKLADALAKAQSVLRGAEKDRANPFFKSNYATLSSVWEACREALTANGLSVMQPVSSQGRAVTVTTLLSHASGEWVRADLTVEAKDAGAQSIGSAISYGRRYGLSSMVGVAAAEDDDDGNAATHGTTSPAKRPAGQGPKAQRIADSAKPREAVREPGEDDGDPGPTLADEVAEMMQYLEACKTLPELQAQKPALEHLRKRLKAEGEQAWLDRLTKLAKERHEAITGKDAVTGDPVNPMPGWAT